MEPLPPIRAPEVFGFPPISYNWNDDVVRLLEALQEMPGPAGWLLRTHQIF